MTKFTLTLQHKRLLFWLVLLLVSYKLLTPMKHSGIHIPHIDKVAHITVFALLSYLAYISYQLVDKTQLLVWGGYGLSMELLQGLTTHRSADIFDFIANMIGVFITLFYIKRTTDG